MSHTAKGWTAIIVILAVVIIGGAWYSYSHSAPTTYSVETAPAPTQTTQTQPTDSAGMSSQSDNSDAALQQDLGSTDSQMNSFNADTAASAQ